jgi:hypothetical protein
MVKHVNDVVYSSEDEIRGGSKGHTNFSRKPRYSGGDPVSPRGKHPDCVTPISVQGRTKVPAIFCMGGPRCSEARFYMHKDANSGRGNGSAVEVKSAIKLRPCREFGIDAGAME